MKFLFFPSGGEMVLIVLAILLLFGADKMPEFFRMFTKGMSEFRKATDDIKREFNDASTGIQNEITQSKKYIENEIQEYKEEAESTFLGDDDFAPYSDMGDEMDDLEETDSPIEEAPTEAKVEEKKEDKTDSKKE